MTTAKKIPDATTAADMAVEQVEATVAAGKDAVETLMRTGSEIAGKSLEKVAAVTSERVDAAAKAGSEAFRTYEDMVAFGKDNVDAAVTAGTVLSRGVQEIQKAWFVFAQESLNGGVVAAKSLLGAKTLKDAIDVQNTLARDQVSRMVAESRRIGDMSLKLAEDVASPLAGRVAVALDTFGKPLAA